MASPKFTHADAVRKLTVERDLANQRAKAAELKAAAAEFDAAQAKAEAAESKASLERLRNLVDDITEMDVFDDDFSTTVILDACREAQKDWTYATPTTLKTAAE